MSITITIASTPQELGEKAALLIATLLNQSISERGQARILLSTGTSQFETIEALTAQNVDWAKVEMFHLDEYVGLPESHLASFRKYLQERFVSKLPLKATHFVNGEGNVAENIAALTAELRKCPIDVGVIGIGENGHIAFNDPPADFETEVAYKVVDLDDRCKQQQVGEGWFRTIQDVPLQAITMCPKQILSCKHIITSVPHAVKAEAIFNTITKPISPLIPATLLKTHRDWNLFIDSASATKLLACNN